MPAISVQVGNEEKEISGLNRKTTCAEVIEALLNDKQTEVTIDRENGQQVLDSDDSKNSNLQELAKNYIIVENWRGCEKPLPLQTRILSVWRAWGKEQCHVKFSLKKDKNGRFRVGRHKEDLRDDDISFIHDENKDQDADVSHYIHKLSHGQKKRIRRSLMQYQRAVLNQRPQDRIDGNNNAGKKHTSRRADRVAGDRALSSRQKIAAGTMAKITLSEEQFVDGVVTNPECVLRHDGKIKFMRNISDKQFNKERCNYRRPHHRRLSLLQEDSDGVTDQNVTLSRPNKNESHHSPYCSKSKKRSRSKQQSRHRSSHRDRVSHRQRKHKLHGSKCSTDSNPSTASASLSSDVEHKSYSEGEDADDEKSIMADFSTSVSRQKLAGYPGSLLPFVETYNSGTASPSTATITDSSSATTTCSETSNTSGCSFTTSSSETSSTAELESYYARRDAAKANANEKHKSGAARLFRIAKPAQSIIGSFKRKKRPQPTQQNPTKPAQVSSLPNNSAISKQQDNSTVESDANNTNQPSATTQQLSKTSINDVSNQQSDTNRKLTEEEQKIFDELEQLILTQEKSLNFKNVKVKSVETQIGRIETQVTRLSVKDHENNFKTSDVGDLISGKDFQTSSPRSLDWIQDCSDANALEEYLSACERVVSKQMQIEEHKRNTEILIQDVQNEMWKTSNDPGLNLLTLDAAVLGLTPPEDENSSDDDTDTSPDTLSVSSGKTLKPSSDNENDSSVTSGLELERTRAEMEANLYLGLRLSTELEEVDKLMSNSKQLLQSKGESLLTLVRNLAQSDEGISSDLWEEYGDLLAAYDSEVALQQYLVACAENDIATRVLPQSETLEGNKQPAFLPNGEPDLPQSDGLHRALSPWLWCEHCKQELEQAQKFGGFENFDSSSSPPHWLSHSDVPPNFSSLPLPSPSVIVDPRSTGRVSGLLPMLPVPDRNDSDCDEIPDKRVHDETIGATSTIISTEDSVPRGIVFRHFSTRRQGHQESPTPRSAQLVDSLSSTSGNSCSNTDDSGNASAGSTASFASSISDSIDITSRNSSCDGDSPRPPSVGTESQDSAQSSPFFSRSRNTNKNRFLFSNGSKQVSKVEQTKNRNNVSNKPSVPAKPRLLRTSVTDSDFAEQPKRLTRSNSGRNKRANKLAPELLNRRATSFGKGAIKAPTFQNQLSGILKKPFVNNSHCDLTQKGNSISKDVGIKNKQTSKSVTHCMTPLYSTTLQTSNISVINGLKMRGGRDSPRQMNFSVFSDVKHKRSPLAREHLISYDNDSDTGLSSLHSTDSCDRLSAPTGETLV